MKLEAHHVISFEGDMRPTDSKFVRRPDPVADDADNVLMQRIILAKIEDKKPSLLRRIFRRSGR